ncbi:MAG TPA: U32 family peptidase [Steroidobacter sp.]|uniref:U32 family peptidase n=1 Tax=Steroidobacter sp. TaxID=1978227 RepID=UPI002EDB320C
MKIVAPISRIPDIEAVARAGANELYCGIVPREWLQAFGAATANRRPTGNLASSEDLRCAVATAHEHGCTLALTLNAQQYSADQTAAALEIAAAFLEMGGDALIISDLGLMQAVSESLPSARIHVSSVATCRNANAVRFYQKLGAARVILPRDVMLEEAVEIAADVPDVEIEVFVLNDGCVFEEGVCNTIHLPNQLGGPICLDKYHYVYRRRDGRDLSARLQRLAAETDREYQKWLWYRFSCGFSSTPDGLPYGPCALCAVPRLRSGGVSAVKIAGREASTARKVASVKMVRKIVEAAAAGAPERAVAELARNLRPSPEHCATGYMCYYPEVVTSFVENQ